MFPRRRFTKEYPTHCRGYAETRKTTTATLSALQPKQHLSDEVYDKIAAVHNSSVGHWGQAKCRAKLNEPFTCASYNPFEVIHLDHPRFDRRILSVGRTFPHQDNDGMGIGVSHILTYGTIQHT
jgi:hypothetical protein